MTVRDFKTSTMAVMKDKIEEQRHFSLAVGMAIAAAFDGKASKKVDDSITKILRTLDKEQEMLYTVSTTAGSAGVITEQARAEDGGLDGKAVRTWQNLGKLDAAYSKLTGKMTGAPWSKVNQANKNADFGSLSAAAERVTGEQIMSQIATRAGRMRPGRRK